MGGAEGKWEEGRKWILIDIIYRVIKKICWKKIFKKIFTERKDLEKSEKHYLDLEFKVTSIIDSLQSQVCPLI